MSNNRFEELAAKNMGMEIAEETTQEETPKQESQTTETPAAEETPKAEVTEENSSLKEDITTETSTEEAPQVDFSSLLDEKSGGKFKSYEDIETALNAISSDKSTSFANEQIEKLNDYVAKGGDVSEYLRTQTANYEEMDESSLVKASMRFNNPELTKEDIDLLFKDKYKLDEDEYMEDEVRLSKIKLKQASKKSKDELIKFQKDNSTPKTHRDVEAEKAQIEESQNVWKSRIDEGMKEFKKVEFDINDKGEKFTFELSDKALGNTTKTTKNLSTFWNRYVNEDGSENISKLVREMSAIENLDSIVRSAYAQGAASGKENVIEDIKNPSYSPESRGDSDKPLSMQEQIAAELRKNM